jgi:hypothetical protein
MGDAHEEFFQEEKGLVGYGGACCRVIPLEVSLCVQLGLCV